MRWVVGVAAFIACLAVGLIYVQSLEPEAVSLVVVIAGASSVVVAYAITGGIPRSARPGWALPVALATLIAVLTAIYLAPSTGPGLALLCGAGAAAVVLTLLRARRGLRRARALHR